MTEIEIETVLTIFGAELKGKPIRQVKYELKQQLNKAYKETFGKQLNMGCSSCIVEGFFLLKNRNENQLKSNIMSNNKFELKPGLMPYIGHLKKFVTNKILTDDLAIEIVKFNSNNAKLFTNPEAILAAAGAAPTKTQPKKSAAAPLATNTSGPDTTSSEPSGVDAVQTVVVDVPKKSHKKKAAAKK
jgi:hypothetical protein